MRIPFLHGYALAASAMADTLAISLPTVVDAVLGRMTMPIADSRLAGWSEKVVRDAEIDLRISGREHLTPRQPYIVMSNHQSHYDIPTLFRAFPGSLRMVTKIELFRVPVWGRAMHEAGFIAVDRRNHEAAIRSLAAAKKRLATGISVWIAPEGTRSLDGRLAPFKRGGFVLAQETDTPILPVGIDGTRRVLPAKGACVRPGQTVHLRFGEAIAPTGDREALVRTVRQAIQKLMEGRADDSIRVC